MDKPIYLGFSVLELSKLLMYETYHDIFQSYFGDENIQYHYGNTDAMVLSIKTKDIVEDLYNLRDFFEFSNLNKEHKLFSEENKKVVGIFKIETSERVWIDEFVCLRSKAYSFECGVKNENKLEGISNSQTKNIKFEEYYNCLFGGDYQKKCDNFKIKSKNYDMFHQKVTKNSLSAFDEKRCYLNNIQSIPWD